MPPPTTGGPTEYYTRYTTPDMPHKVSDGWEGRISSVGLASNSDKNGKWKRSGMKHHAFSIVNIVIVNFKMAKLFCGAQFFGGISHIRLASQLSFYGKQGPAGRWSVISNEIIFIIYYSFLFIRDVERGASRTTLWHPLVSFSILHHYFFVFYFASSVAANKWDFSCSLLNKLN